jgi:TetR/AcrR family transcriptional regulator, transcriptional repressor of bet genes
MTQAAPRATPNSRVLAREKRRDQLIQATINCVANKGFSATTMADITSEAGLSLGIVNLHFQSKEKLLMETLEYLAEEYKGLWEKALDESGPEPAAKLAALIELDFSKGVAERKKLAVWFAFWGETRSHPDYIKTCAAYDRHYAKRETELFAELISEGKYQDLDARILTTTLDALTEGLWLDMLLMQNKIDRNQAKAIVMSYLHNILPGHF